MNISFIQFKMIYLLQSQNRRASYKKHELNTQNQEINNQNVKLKLIYQNFKSVRLQRQHSGSLLRKSIFTIFGAETFVALTLRQNCKPLKIMKFSHDEGSHTKKIN
jgi:hypothetical protein